MNDLVNGLLGYPVDADYEMREVWAFIDGIVEPVNHNGNRMHMPSGILRLRFDENGMIACSQPKIAKRMGVSTTRVRQLLFNARREILRPARREERDAIIKIRR